MKSIILAVVLLSLTACYGLDVPPKPQHSPTTCTSCRALEGAHLGCRWGSEGKRCECSTNCDCDYIDRIPKKKRAGVDD